MTVTAAEQLVQAVDVHLAFDAKGRRSMRATVMYGAGDVRIENVPDARLIEPTDALVRVTRACICGSDLWPYNQMEPSETGQRMGHEFIGVVEAIGSDVRTAKVGDLVVAPFAWSDGTCVFCQEGLHTSCLHGRLLGQGRHRRGSGRGGAGAPGRRNARRPASRRRRSADAVASSERGDEAVERVREVTNGFGAHSVLECVGYEQATVTALSIARPGGAVGRVGLPQQESIPTTLTTFFDNVTISGGPAPARAYIEELLPDVLEGKIEPGRVFDKATNLEGVPGGYRAMNEREAIKVMIEF
jgi:threonine dehydrogenase-like Zn-dependent dehydrogenase